jgi:hypothetical protein
LFLFQGEFFPLHFLLPTARCPLVHSYRTPSRVIRALCIKEGCALRGQAVFLQTAAGFIGNGIFNKVMRQKRLYRSFEHPGFAL